MTFVPQVERWRIQVLATIKALQASYPAEITRIDALGLTNDALAEIVLALIQNESSGNEWALGDPIPGQVARPSNYFTQFNFGLLVPTYNSVGLMMLDYGTGTPQGLGFTGSKQDLADPNTNIYYGIKYFMVKLREQMDVNKAILAYNSNQIEYTSSGVPTNQNYLADVLSILKVPLDWFNGLSPEKKTSV
jgi:hypothetical protein